MSEQQSARVEAAAEALKPSLDLMLMERDRSFPLEAATEALAAADAVMFDDAAEDKISELIWENCYGVDALALTRKIFSALKGDGQ